MPNECSFEMVVKGKPHNLKEFLDYFIFEDECRVKKKPYLARTFVNDFKDKQDYVDKNYKDIRDGFIRIIGWCAWSCYSCWIEGYPDKCEDNIKIANICKKHNVEIQVDSEEPGIGFVENITCNGKGYLTTNCKDFTQLICSKCKDTQGISPNSYPGDEECYNCGVIGEWNEI